MAAIPRTLGDGSWDAFGPSAPYNDLGVQHTFLRAESSFILALTRLV